MREAARALDDVSEHLGEVLRRADDLLAEWSRFGAEVRAQVEREAAAIGEVVEGAVGRAAGHGIDRAIGDRLRALTVEIERLEQRTRAASRAVVDQREGDRRLLWAVVAGILLANALLVVVLLRRPEAAPAAGPILRGSTSAPRRPIDPQGTAPEVDVAGPANPGSATRAPSSMPPAAAAGASAPINEATAAPSNGQGRGEQPGRGPPGPIAAPSAGARSASRSGAARQSETAAPRPISPPPKSGTARLPEKLP